MPTERKSEKRHGSCRLSRGYHVDHEGYLKVGQSTNTWQSWHLQPKYPGSPWESLRGLFHSSLSTYIIWSFAGYLENYLIIYMLSRKLFDHIQVIEKIIWSYAGYSNKYLIICRLFKQLSDHMQVIQPPDWEIGTDSSGVRSRNFPSSL